MLTPRTIRQFNRNVLSILHKASRGNRILKDVSRIAETDRWNSFDQFHKTAKTLVQGYEAAGVKAETYSIPTGGPIGSGRWVIQEAADFRSVTIDVIQPVRERVVDYKEDPWHAVLWSAATAPGGQVNDLVVIDTQEALKEARTLVGKIVLTGLDVKSQMKEFVSLGAAGVITDRAVEQYPGAIHWTRFGWGGIPYTDAANHLVAAVLSLRQGARLRKLFKQHGSLKLKTVADIHRYAGSHDLVSGLVMGQDPEDELWVLAHTNEPGAHDNASGVALCLEIARVLEQLIGEGKLPRPKRTIRFLNGYECYSFFHFIEHTRRLQTPLAGVCIDTIGARPSICEGQLSWRSTIPMSAGFVDRVGASIIQSALRLNNPGYKLTEGPFVSTSDTLLGEPQYGFPCPWLTTHYRKGGDAWKAYHTSADQLNVLSSGGLKVSAAAMAGYLYFLATAGDCEVSDLAKDATQRCLRLLSEKPSADQADYLRDQHHVSLDRLKRWVWGADRSRVVAQLAEFEGQIKAAGPRTMASRSQPGMSRIPYRTVPISPTSENTPPLIAEKIRSSGLPAWALFWADGNRTLHEIARSLSVERSESTTAKQVTDYFEAHEELGYLRLVSPEDVIRKASLLRNLKAIGLQTGMDVMVHSSLSRIGHIAGGPNTLIDAILAVIGKRGTLMMPSFNHRSAKVYNPAITPTTNGAIPDAFRSRPDVIRSLHPTHALAATGPKAEELLRNHLESGLWTADSPLSRFIQGGGYVLSIGVDHNTSTAYHVGEVSIPCGCIDPFGHVDRVVMPDGCVQDVKGLAFRSETCPVPPGKLNETLSRKKLQTHGKIGDADSTLVKAVDIWKARRDHVKDVCPGCTIKPAYS